MSAARDDWRYAPYHKWKFTFSHGDYGYSGANLGIAAIAAYLRKYGIQTLLTDGYLEDLSVSEQAMRILTYAPHLLGVTMMSNVNLGDVASLCTELRHRGYKEPIIVGGHYPALHPARVLNALPEVQAICCGDGEEVTLAAATEAAAGRPLRGIQGLVDRTAPVNRPAQRSLHSLDDYPFIARDLLRLELDRGFVPGICSSRGCSGHCTFCAPTLYEKALGDPSWRYRSPKSVAAEVCLLVDTFNIQKYKYVDLNFLNAPEGGERARRIARLLRRRRVFVPFMFDTRVDCISAEVLHDLKEVGLWGVYVGLESCSARQLALFKKGTTPVQNAAATSLLQELNLALIPGSITFEPSTTPDEVLASLAYLQSLNGFSIYRFARGVIPREGTALFHQYESEGCLVKTGYDYSICCKDARVQALFERLQYLAHLAYNFEKKNHERVSEQFSITQIPDRMKGSLRELEADLKRVVLTLAADCTTRLLSGDSDDPAQAPRAFAWLDGVFDERLKGLGV